MYITHEHVTYACCAYPSFVTGRIEWPDYISLFRLARGDNPTPRIHWKYDIPARVHFASAAYVKVEIPKYPKPPLLLFTLVGLNVHITLAALKGG